MSLEDTIKMHAEVVNESIALKKRVKELELALQRLIDASQSEDIVHLETATEDACRILYEW